MLLVSFMLFSLFFGAGNLIFPPFLGQNAGAQTIPALLGFLLTAVVLPVLGVVVVARFDGLDRLGQQVSPRFGLIFAVLIYLSIGLASASRAQPLCPLKWPSRRIFRRAQASLSGWRCTPSFSLPSPPSGSASRQASSSAGSAMS